MATTEIDELQIRIEAEATKANTSIDLLADKLDRLYTSLGRIDGTRMRSLASGVTQLASSVKGFASIDGRTFTALAKNIDKIANINSSGVGNSATAISSIATAFNQLGNVSQASQNMATLVSSISKLGNKGVTNAIVNIPQLANSMNQLMVTLSKAPTVNKSVIDMTNALANLASQGSKVGSASASVVNGLNRTNAVAKRASGSTMSLARAFGKFYANYFLLVRGFKGMFNMMESAMELTETVNYFEVTLRNIGENARENWKEYGYESADAYADSFAERLRESNEKLTGFTVSETGQISQSVFSGLGISPATATQYSAMFAQVANSIGMTEEASIALSEAFVRLGADWASLRNVDFEVAYEKLASGLAGQSRALRAFGVDITMATLQEIAFANGIEKSVSEMTQSEKAYLRLIAIIEQSEVAFGDLANTLASPANQMRMLSQGVQNLGTLVGNLFLPILSKTLPVLNGFVIAMQRIVIAISETMGIDTSGFNTSLGGMDEGFGDLSDSVDEATESAEKFNRATRGWDELNVLGKDTSKGYGVGNDLVENKQLLDAYDESIEKYRKAWEKAYDNINNEAEDFADELLKNIKVDKIVEGFKSISDSAKELSEAVTPLFAGVATGFSESMFDKLESALSIFADLVEDVDPDDVYKIGESIGELLSIFVVYKSVAGIVTSITTATKGFAGVLKNPIFASFVLATGILDLVHAVNDTNYNSDEIDEYVDSLNNLNEAYKNFTIEDVDGHSSAESLQTIYEKWSAIATKTGELTEGDKALLKQYGDMLKEICPAVTPFIDENGQAFVGVQDEIQKAIDKTLLYYKVQGAQDYLKGLVEQEIQFDIETDRAKEKIQELVNRIKEINPKITEKEIYDFAQSLAKGYGTASDILKGREKEFGIKRNWLGIRTKEGDAIYDEVANIITDLSKLWPEQEESLENLVDIRDKVSDATEKYTNLQSEYNKEVKDGTEITKNSVVEIAEQNKKLNEFKKSLEGLDGKTFTAELQVKSSILDPYEIFKSVGSLLPNIKIPKYATGGFPEDGLFMANHSELVGKFANGKTAVANNDQITKGIEEASYRGMMRALQNADMGSKATFEVVGDPNGMFRVMQKQANQYTKSTGRNAFGY